MAEAQAANRRRTQQLISNAEQLAQQTVSQNAGEGSDEAATRSPTDIARIAELEKTIASRDKLVRILQREQRENTKLIAQYEIGVERMTAMIRDSSYAHNTQLTQQAKSYNTQLQQEKDDHLQTRLERDEYMAKVHHMGEQMREAYRLRCEEGGREERVVMSLQAQVRVLLQIAGVEGEIEHHRG